MCVEQPMDGFIPGSQQLPGWYLVPGTRQQ